MKQMKSLSDKRLIVKAMFNGKEANLLIDTGATVGLLSDGIVRKYGLVKGRRFPKPLVGAGGEFYATYCNTFANLQGKTVSQFLIADIDNVIGSIRRETGIEIHGILSLPQMKMAGIQIDANDNLIIIE